MKLISHSKILNLLSKKYLKLNSLTKIVHLLITKIDYLTQVKTNLQKLRSNNLSASKKRLNEIHKLFELSILIGKNYLKFSDLN